MNTDFKEVMNNNYIPNTSSIPNILFDFWMEKLSPAEFKVLMCVARKTYGWHKHYDSISIKQIESMTGLHRSGIIKNVEKLVEIGLLNKIKSQTADGDAAANRYEINVYCVGGGSLHSRPQVVDSVDYGVVYSVDTQNKDNTKEKLTKEEKGDPPPAQDLGFFSEKKKEREKHVCVSESNHKDLVKNLGEERTKECYKFLSEWKMDSPRSKWKKDDYRSILRWVVDAVKEKAQKKKKEGADEDNPENNRAFALKIADNFNPIRCKEKGCRMEVLSKHFEIVFTRGNHQPFCLSYTEKGFREQLESALKKFQLS